jgi:hypothetical protein
MAITSRPKYRRLAYAMQGLSWLGQILYGLRNPPRLELLEDWTIELHGLLIVVPQGFLTDGASIPRLLWWLISPFGPLLEGAILHDFAYQHGYLLARYNVAQPYNIRSLSMRLLYAGIFTDTIPVFIEKPRIFFDELLLYVTIELSGASLQAHAAYAALRPFGAVAWMRYRNRGPAAYNTNSLYLPGVKT